MSTLETGRLLLRVECDKVVMTEKFPCVPTLSMGNVSLGISVYWVEVRPNRHTVVSQFGQTISIGLSLVEQGRTTSCLLKW